MKRDEEAGHAAPRDGDQATSVPRFNLGDVLFVILVLSLVFSIMARAVRSGSDLEWSGVGLAFSALRDDALPRSS